MTSDDRAIVLPPGEGKTLSFSGTFSGNRVTFIYKEPEAAYSIIEWAAAPGAPGTPPHLHRATDEAFYVLEGTLGFQVGQRALEISAGAFVFVPKGLEHGWWNEGTTPLTLPAGVRKRVSATNPGWARYRR